MIIAIEKLMSNKKMADFIEWISTMNRDTDLVGCYSAS